MSQPMPNIITVDDDPTPELRPMTWTAFRHTGAFWFVNRILHAFGLVIVVESNGDYEKAYPARTIWRGFDPEIEARGYRNLAKYMADTAGSLFEEMDK